MRLFFCVSFLLWPCSIVLFLFFIAATHCFSSQKVFYHMQVFGDDALYVDVQETDGGEGSVILLMKVCMCCVYVYKLC